MNTPHALDTCTELRRDTTKAIHTLSDLITENGQTPRAKILAAHIIASEATSAALLTRLRFEIRNPGDKP